VDVDVDVDQQWWHFFVEAPSSSFSSSSSLVFFFEKEDDRTRNRKSFVPYLCQQRAPTQIKASPTRHGVLLASFVRTYIRLWALVVDVDVDVNDVDVDDVDVDDVDVDDI